VLGREYSDIILFSVEPTASGSLDTRRLDPAGFALAGKLKHAGVKRVLVTVGGSQRSAHFAEAAVTPHKRAQLIAALLKLCAARQLDGVDFDWEHPKTPVEEAEYSQLIVETAHAFRQKKLLVSVAVAAWQQLDRAAIEAADRINLMAYDAPREHSTYDFATGAVADWLAMGARPEQLCLGVPFYGRGVEHHHRAASYSQIAAAGCTDPNCNQWGDYYFNGIAAIRHKADFARRTRLGGIMAWEVGQDTPQGTLGSALGR